MTWRTILGERVIQGAEAQLLRTCLGFIRDTVRMELEEGSEGYHYGIPLFDNLRPESKMAMLVEVGHALFHETPTYPIPNALNESTVAALYSCLEDLLRFELEDYGNGETKIREAILAATREVETGEDDPEEYQLPEPFCDDPDRWDPLIETLEGSILWDYDYLDYKHFVDGPFNGEHYYQAPIPNPQDEEMLMLRAKLDALLLG